MPTPNSFIICNISISYPKRRIFDIFQQKKICIVESIEFIFNDNENLWCHASVYVAKWFNGKVCEKFLEQLYTQRSVDFIDDHHIWKIIPTPTIIERNTTQKWFQQIQDDY